MQRHEISGCDVSIRLAQAIRRTIPFHRRTPNLCLSPREISMLLHVAMLDEDSIESFRVPPIMPEHWREAIILAVAY